VVNDIEKLNKVIGSLEEQATRVTEFNGILASVNEARSEIESSKKILKNASAEHQQLIADSHSKFDELLKRLVSIEQKLANLEQGNESVQRLGQKIDDASQAHRSSLKTLKFIALFGILVLAIGIAFLAKKILF